MSKDTDTPDEFGSCMKLDCTTADTSIAAAEVFLIQQPIEGQNVQQFKKGTSDAEKITLGLLDAKGNPAKRFKHAEAKLQRSDYGKKYTKNEPFVESR